MMKMSQGSLNSEVYSEPGKTSKMRLFAKIVNSRKPVAIFAESFIVDFSLGSEYASEFNDPWLIFIIDIFTKSLIPRTCKKNAA